MANDEKQCFIIMPITTPEPLLDVYRDGAEHFEHVLNCLLVPAVEKAGFKAWPPSAKGADLIHAKIINNLETADLVLCDMSALNPNVFFEFGMRTALNRPLCLVKDELTKKVPFDTGILNYHSYASSLEPWQLEKEISKLASHIEESATHSQGENDLWRYFGIKSEAKAYEGATGTDAKLDHVMLQMDALLRKVDRVERDEIPKAAESDLHHVVNQLLPPGCSIHSVDADPNRCTATVYHSGKMEADHERYAVEEVRNLCGFSVEFKSIPF